VSVTSSAARETTFLVYDGSSGRAACERLGIAQSMDRPGSALDNAVIESWHPTLEIDLRSLHQFASKAQARTAVAAWIEDYNTVRRHSALGMRSPAAYEQSLKGKDTQ
jgi:putative transposase